MMSQSPLPQRVMAPLDDGRGPMGMTLFIATEALLFVMLFFAYYYLGADRPRWPMDPPPKLRLALPMLAVLLTSSAVLHWGESQLKNGARRVARLSLAATLALGAVFLVLQYLEFREHLQTLTPRTNAYGSIFYTITGVHAAHVGLGMLMLGFVLPLRWAPRDRPPHRPLRTASLYWHFVDLMWVFIVGLLYVWPNLAR
jgi:cytochrome c oxidase subunit 3